MSGKSSLVKPSPKFASVSLLLLVLAGALLIVYRHRIRIEAWFWHLRHGEAVAIGGYAIPVPRNWYVSDMGLETETLVRLDAQETARPRPSNDKPRFPATVNVFLSSFVLSKENLPRFTSLESSLLKKAGVEPIVRTFEFDGETLSCVGGDTFSHATGAPLFYEVDPVVWTCRSSGRLQLSIIATDADIMQAWDIISHIVRKS